jgi:hypothetical protein
MPMTNYGVYDDELVRTSEGWRFQKREFRFYYLDKAPLCGSSVPIAKASFVVPAACKHPL